MELLAHLAFAVFVVLSAMVVAGAWFRHYGGRAMEAIRRLAGW